MRWKDGDWHGAAPRTYPGTGAFGIFAVINIHLLGIPLVDVNEKAVFEHDSIMYTRTNMFVRVIKRMSNSCTIMRNVL